VHTAAPHEFTSQVTLLGATQPPPYADTCSRWMKKIGSVQGPTAAELLRRSNRSGCVSSALADLAPCRHRPSARIETLLLLFPPMSHFLPLPTPPPHPPPPPPPPPPPSSPRPPPPGPPPPNRPPPRIETALSPPSRTPPPPHLLLKVARHAKQPPPCASYGHKPHPLRPRPVVPRHSVHTALAVATAWSYSPPFAARDTSLYYEPHRTPT
jgi:hypothetical protein